MADTLLKRRPATCSCTVLSSSLLNATPFQVGSDRVLQLTFGHGNHTALLFLEFYAGGRNPHP